LLFYIIRSKVWTVVHCDL